MAMDLARLPVLLLVLGGCLAGKPGPVVRPVQREPQTGFRLKLCREQPLRLQAGPGAPQTRGCVVTFRQPVTDPATLAWAKTTRAERRYVVYAPANLPSRPVPVVFVFPGATCNAEAAAVYHTHARFEQLADRDGFVVVYGNGLPTAAHSGNDAPMPKGGFLPGCWAAHTGEGLDVTYVRLIVAQLAEELEVDRTRIYATGISQGGGMSFQLALEAPDLVAAIAPVASVPFQPQGDWLRSCHPKPGYDHVSIAMVAATADPFIPYASGSSVEVPEADFVGMEATRDAWLAALHPIPSKCGAACGGSSARPTKTSTLPTKRGSSFSGIPSAHEPRRAPTLHYRFNELQRRAEFLQDLAESDCFDSPFGGSQLEFKVPLPPLATQSLLATH